MLDAVRLTLEKIIAYDGPVPGNSPVECGNYSNLSLAAAQKEAAAYLEVLTSWQPEHLTYPTAPATE